jgi:hypothetical protein
MIPACVEACEKRLGDKRPLHFGKRDEIRKMAHARAMESNGYIYGERENGGTSTFYVSKVPFEKIHARLQESKSSLLMGKVQNALDDVNRWAKGFIFGPLAGGGAVAWLFTRGARKERGRNAMERILHEEGAVLRHTLAERPSIGSWPFPGSLVFSGPGNCPCIKGTW